MVKQLIVIQGPTASGKTALAIAVAQHFNTVIISADSRQFYREMNIGTAKPNAEELAAVKHYFIDSHSIENPLSAGQFEAEAMELLQNELKDLETVVVVGGSGMFIDALCKGLDDVPTDENIRGQLRNEYETRGLQVMLNELRKTDPVYYEEVDRQNSHRVLRALEVIRITGKPFSDLRKNFNKERPFVCRYFHIDHDREELYNRINHRVDLMIEAGLIDEVKALENKKDLASLQTVGYQELFDCFDGVYLLDEAIDKIKQHTRNYAKRQMTWIRRNPNSIALIPGRKKTLLEQLLKNIENQSSEDLE